MNYDLICKCGCGLEPAPDAVECLASLIVKMGKTELKITSGARCKSYNDRIGGSATSDHIKGIAFDIQCLDPVLRRNLLSVLLAQMRDDPLHAFGIIEICDRHIHISRRFDGEGGQRVILGISK